MFLLIFFRSKCLHEKRRRDQENQYLDELAKLVSASMSDLNKTTRPDKCTILQETINQISRIKNEGKRHFVLFCKKFIYMSFRRMMSSSVKVVNVCCCAPWAASRGMLRKQLLPAHMVIREQKKATEDNSGEGLYKAIFGYLCYPQRYAHAANHRRIYLTQVV